jgi:hypothetical protein
MQVIIWYIANNIQYVSETTNFNVRLRYCVLLKIKIFYVYIKLFRTIILTSAPSITSTFKRILSSKCLCRVRFCFLINILKKQYEAERALDSIHKPSLVYNQLWAKVLGRYVCDIDWHPRYSVSLIMRTVIVLEMFMYLPFILLTQLLAQKSLLSAGTVKALG